MKKKNLLIYLNILTGIMFNSIIVSAYIDPGTGGYLATTIFSQILTFLAIAIATVGAFFSNRLIKPLKNFWKNKKKVSVLLILAILIILVIILINFFIQNESSNFDPSLSGTHIINPGKISQGYNLYDGKLIDNQGNLVKNWSSIYLGVIDSNGDYYAQSCFECPLWGKYSWNGSVIWEKDFAIHHQILLTPQNTLIVLGKEVHEYNERKVEFDTVLEYDKNGNLLNTWSNWANKIYLHQFHKDLTLDSPPSFLVPEKDYKNKSVWGGNYDYYHMNHISIIPNNSLQYQHRAFTPGNWIISFRHGSMIFILDKDTKEVLWRAIYDQVQDNLEGQHSPYILPNGNIVIFDNGRYRGWSRVIALNPVTMQIEWEYKASDFFSLSQSYVQSLPNNNLLITESEKGRVFELTPNKEIVWEFYHPDIQNSTNSVNSDTWGERQQIYKMERYPKYFIDNIIKEKGI